MPLNSKILGVNIIRILAVIPVILWLLAPTVTPRFDNFTGITTSIGQIFGLVGVTLFAVNLILSARLLVMEKLFQGLNDLYVKHGALGQLALILLLFHPLFLLPKYANNISEAVSFLWFSSYWPRNWGILSLGLMLVLLVLTLYLRPKYNIWKWTHKFLGGAFFLASLHVWFIPSDTSRYLPLKIYILVISFWGLIAFAYRSIFNRWLVSKYNYTVLAINQLNEQVLEIVMKPDGERLKFHPGQFVFVRFLNSEVGGEVHPFSLASLSKDENISIVVKKLGDYTAELSSLAVGTKAAVEGPFGIFSSQNLANKSQIWIAGGIGITPFLSMVRDLSTWGEIGGVDLYYCLKNRKEGVYLDLLEHAVVDSNGRFRLFLVCLNENMLITAKMVREMSGNLENKEILICAPLAMITSLRDQFVKLNISEKKIHSEEFSF